MQTKHTNVRVKPNRVLTVGPKFNLVVNHLFGHKINNLTEHYTNVANRYLTANGPKWTCSRLKAYYDVSCRLSLDMEISNIPFTKTNSQGVPRDLIPMLPWLRSSDHRKRRACLTLLRTYVQLHAEVSYDTSTITEPGPGKLFFDQYEPHFIEVIGKYKHFLKPELRDESMFTSSKRGPNGQCLLDLDKDYQAIHDSGLIVPILRMHKEVERSKTGFAQKEVNLAAGFAHDFDLPLFESDLVGDSSRLKRKKVQMKSVAELIRFAKKQEPKRYNKIRTSKLSFLAEGGCKTRVIAQGDYFTQDALKPLHKSLYRCLRKLQTDGTSSHNIISQVVRERTSKGSYVGSFDLTAATDRFPIFLQEMVISGLYGPTVGSLWRRLMVNRTFVAEDGNKVKYAVGQPMGLLSSWAAFALTHHITIEALALKLGKPGFKDYCLIGDDVTIFDKAVANEYRSFLNHFRIQISETKSLVSEGNPSAAEIAKRLFLDGEEMSPIPYDAIESAIKDYRLFPNLLKLCVERGIDVFANPASVQSMLDKLFPKGNRAFNTLVLLTFPRSVPPLSGVTLNPWEGHHIDLIDECFTEIRKDFIVNNAKGLYQNELQNIPDMGVLGLALESEEAPDVTNHPLFILLRAYRDRVGSIYQGIVIKGLENSELDLIPFLVNPMIPQYLRRTHQIEKVRSSLILKAFRKLIQTIQV